MYDDPLIRVENLSKHFPVKMGFMKYRYIRAVEDVTLNIKKGETLGIVGESGCGKSTLGRTILRLYEPTSGKIIFKGKDITKVNMFPYRKKMQIIFQDPSASLNPRMTVGEIIGEAIDIHKLSSTRKEQNELVRKLLEEVGLAHEHYDRYPHEFSGGQQQRVGIARALAVRPEFIVCDEPVSALDVSIQAQITNMLKELQETQTLTYLFIAHDLAIVKYISDSIGVMYLGNIVELGDTKQICKNPLHPYTKALLSAIPIREPKKIRNRNRILLKGEIPNPLELPRGCRFHTRCPHSMKCCEEEIPEWREIAPKHYVACHLI